MHVFSPKCEFSLKNVKNVVKKAVKNVDCVWQTQK